MIKYKFFELNIIAPVKVKTKYRNTLKSFGESRKVTRIFVVMSNERRNFVFILDVIVKINNDYYLLYEKINLNKK